MKQSGARKLNATCPVHNAMAAIYCSELIQCRKLALPRAGSKRIQTRGELNIQYIQSRLLANAYFFLVSTPNCMASRLRLFDLPLLENKSSFLSYFPNLSNHTELYGSSCEVEANLHLNNIKAKRQYATCFLSSYHYYAFLYLRQ